MLRLQAGDGRSDRPTRCVSRISRRCSRSRPSGRIALHSAGVSIAPDMLWFNLDPASPSARDRPWLQRDELRHAISHAVDRAAIVNTVFLGEAVPIAGPITPGHGEWFRSGPASSRRSTRERRRSCWMAIGLTDRNGDGLLDDAEWTTASFSILTHEGQLGARADGRDDQGAAATASASRSTSCRSSRSRCSDSGGQHDYDAIYFAPRIRRVRSGQEPDFWLSSGPFHVWRPGQKKPATPWEAEIDVAHDARNRRRSMRPNGGSCWPTRSACSPSMSRRCISPRRRSTWPTSARFGGVTAVGAHARPCSGTPKRCTSNHATTDARR